MTAAGLPYEAARGERGPSWKIGVRNVRAGIYTAFWQGPAPL
jgi:hypothetical protein